MAPLSAFLAWHRAQLARAPFTTNIIQSGTLMACGDVAAQAIERRGARDAARDAAPYSASRTLILGSWGGLFNAPFWVIFYRTVNERLPGRIALWVAAAAAVSPPFNAAFFSYTAALTHAVDEGVREGWGTAAGRARMADKVARKVDDKLWPTVARSLTLWVPFNTVMFLYIPLALRPLAGSCVGLGWNVYLSIIAAAAPSVSSAHAPAPSALPL
jgi:hypothetical protein